MPRYYQQAATAVQPPDDIFGYLPELAIMIMKHCLPLLPIPDVGPALLSDVLCAQHRLFSWCFAGGFNDKTMIFLFKRKTYFLFLSKYT